VFFYWPPLGLSNDVNKFKHLESPINLFKMSSRTVIKSVAYSRFELLSLASCQNPKSRTKPHARVAYLEKVTVSWTVHDDHVQEV